MNDNLKDILSNLNKEIEQEKLLDYLNKQLPTADAHDVEKQMTDDPFVNDAVEGLSNFSDKKNVAAYVEQLNYDLQKKLLIKKARKEKRKLKEEPWVYFTIVLLLLLCVLGYVLVKRFM
jgi:hypothetical protein